MNKMGSQQFYPKAGKFTRVKPKGENVGEKDVDERLANRMLIATRVGPTPPERRALGHYGKEVREPVHEKVPRGGTDNNKSVVTEGGLASRGNVIHGRYKPCL